MPESHALAAGLGEWRTANASLPAALAMGIRTAVLDGRLPVGSQLPSERALAQALEVSRGTVVSGLAILRDDGWLDTRHGSGSVVRLPRRLTERTTPWSMDNGGDDTDLDLSSAVTAAPHEAYLRSVDHALTTYGRVLLDSGLPGPGLGRLRETIAARYTSQGRPTRPDQILVTTGAQAALTLLADQLSISRRFTVVENPTFPGALSVLRQRRTRLLSLPVTDDGWDVDWFASAARTHRPALAYLMPHFHNPTGALMSGAVQQTIASTAARHRITVIADETTRDLDLRDSPRALGHVTGLAIGSMSKLIWTGLRVGWIRASAAFVRELQLNPLQAAVAPPPLEQLIADDLLANIETILPERRARLRTQRDHLAALLARGDAWTFRRPPGGLTIWLKLRDENAVRLATRAAAYGLRLAPGPDFSADRTLTQFLRLPFTATTDVLTTAVDRLAAASERG